MFSALASFVYEIFECFKPNMRNLARAGFISTSIFATDECTLFFLPFSRIVSEAQAYDSFTEYRKSF